MRWVKDPKVEASLRADGITFETATVMLDKIDTDEGLRRQARFVNKLNDDAVLTMAEAMSKPDAAFPMPILQKPPHGALLWPWDGNHRIASFKLAYPEASQIDAYLITLRDPVMLDLFPRKINCLTGTLGFDKEARIIQARYMVDKHNMKPAEAAAHFNIKVNWLYVANAENETKELVAGIPRAEKLPKNILRKLHTLKENTNVLRSTVRLLCQHDVKSDDAKCIINDVKSQTTENQMLGELGRWEKILVERKEPKKRVKGTVVMTRSVRESFVKAFTRVAKILETNTTLTQLQLTDPADQAVVFKAWNIIKSVMAKLEQERQK